MKNRLFPFLLLLLSVLRAEASHIFGGELYYRWLGGMTYEVNVALYGDCNGSAFRQLYSQSLTVDLSRGGLLYSRLQLHLDTNTRDEITPVCPKYIDSTQCKSPFFPIYGITRFIYRDTVVLPGPDIDYRFVFDGSLNNAGRTASITNILVTSTNASLIYLIAELDNAEQSNSSPQFTTAPTPFYCQNIEQEYNQGAVDADGDSLVFELADALDAGGARAVYRGNYSGTNPLETGGLLSFNPVNGQMVFTPTITQSAVVVNRVVEYRNGKPVGSSMREMTFIVLSTCNNMPVRGGIDSASTLGGNWSSGNVLNVCLGANSVQFRYDLTDPDGDTVDITVTGLPQGASIAVYGNGTVSPSFDFSWNVAGLPRGNYSFFVTAKDRHCPVSTVQTRGFTIRLVDNFVASHSAVRPTNCYGRAVLNFEVVGGILPFNYTVLQGGDLVRSGSSSEQLFIDSLAAGSYMMRISSPDLLCSADYPFQVVDSGIFPFTPATNDRLFCVGADSRPLTAVGYPGAVLHWYDMDGAKLPSAPVPSTNMAGTQRWLLSQQVGVCASDRKTVEIEIAPTPSLVLDYDTGVVCVGARIFLSATGADVFTWLPAEKIFYEPDGKPFIRVFEASDYAVVGINVTGCSDTLTFSYAEPEPCCTFSYPTAFTPNNDGKNDLWRPILFGNHQTYELSIYNRWGWRLFHSFVPNEGWDGRYDGRLQDVGTYYYFLQARCFTGKEEVKRGSFHLLR